jgi:hypothetical protein
MNHAIDQPLTSKKAESEPVFGRVLTQPNEALMGWNMQSHQPSRVANTKKSD